MKHSEIHSNRNESGALIGEAEASFQYCHIYGNGAAGIVTQQKGIIQLMKCIIHDNDEGVLIQDTGHAKVEKCDIFSNRSNGVFIGFDHRGSATVTDNKVHDNLSKGILVGNSARAVLRGNEEHNNRGLPPRLPIVGAISRQNPSLDKHLNAKSCTGYNTKPNANPSLSNTRPS